MADDRSHGKRRAEERSDSEEEPPKKRRAQSESSDNDPAGKVLAPNRVAALKRLMVPEPTRDTSFPWCVQQSV